MKWLKKLSHTNNCLYIGNNDWQKIKLLYNNSNISLIESCDVEIHIETISIAKGAAEKLANVAFLDRSDVEADDKCWDAHDHDANADRDDEDAATSTV